MMRSLFSGVSGLKSHQTRMDVIGNNVANVNTTGFKSGRTTFADTLSQTLTGASAPGNGIGGTNPKQIGLGTGVASIDTIFTDGSVQSTGKNTDLCLSGSGLFVVKKGDQTFYTRNGAFEFDANGNYVLPSSGLFVQGWTAKDGILTTSGAAGNITIPSGKSMPSKETGTASYSNNLNASTTGYDVSSIVVNYADGTASSTVSSYSPTLEPSNTITVDGKKYFTAVGTFATGDTLTNATLWTSPVSSVTSNGTGTATLTCDGTDSVSPYVAVNGTAGNKAVTVKPASGTYKVSTDNEGYYTATKTIKKATLDNATNTVLLEFDDATDGISSVTVPKPDTGSYAAGASFSVKMKVTAATAETGGTVTCDNGQTDVNITGSFGIGASYSKTLSGTVTAVTQGTGSYLYNGKKVSSISIVSGANTLAGLAGANYTAGSTFYPSVTTTVTAYDSLGSAHAIPVLFTKTADNIWALNLTGGTNSTSISEPDGTVTNVSLSANNLIFDTSGKYVSGNASLTLTPTNGAAPQTISLNLAGLSQYAGNSTINASADGNAAGTLSSVSIDSTGMITGTYTNGSRQIEGQVAVAQFNNASGLTKTGNSLYQESNNSGTANIKTASDLGVTITPSALEMSNVDIANEFSDMIITQRGFQSNSKIITVGDEMLETLIGMKR